MESDDNPRLVAISVLGALQAKEIAPKIAQLLKDCDDDVRRVAAYSLGQMQAKEFALQVTQLLKDSDDDVRRVAAYALGKMQAKEFAPQIAQILKDPSIDVQYAAAKVLGQMQAKEFALQVAQLLKDSNLNVRYAAAQMLGEMQAKEFAPQVAQLINNSDNQDVAAKVLAQMQAKEFAPQVAQLLTSSEWGVRNTAAWALGQMQAKEFAPQVAQLFQDSDFNVQDTATWALGQMQVKEFAPQVAQFLKDSENDVRSSAAKALGQMQAKEFAPQVAQFLTSSYIYDRSSAAKALGQMQAKEFAPQVAQLLKDSEGAVQSSAASALGQMQAKEFAPQVAQLLKDSEDDVRNSAASALQKLGQQDLAVVTWVLDAVERYHKSEIETIAQLRFLAHFIGAGNQDIQTLMQWVGKPKSTPEKLTYQQAKPLMELFDRVWKYKDKLEDLRPELAAKIAEVARDVSWKPQDIGLLTNHYNNLKNSKPVQADAVNSVILNLEGWKWFFAARNIIITHIIFWLALIFAYPKFPQVQAMFFWNPWVRRILGMGYVGFLLAWIPFLRRKLFEPFKPSLLADAGLNRFDNQGYFPDSMVKTPDIQPITQAIPQIKGQIVLVGDSGLGKSMCLRHLVKTSQKIVVYLPAYKCEKGVIEAIQAKLHGQVQDTDFLKSLIYSGALDICIDGLNEVSADTRSQIKQFVESYFRGNIIMTTQPLEWEPPTTAKMYELQALTPQQIETFLLSRQQYLSPDAKITGEYYQKDCKHYLQQALNPQQASEELAAVQRVLSNPMDLTLVALMISQGEPPDLFRLQQQQYTLMSQEFLQERKHEFPLKKFCQAVYQMRLNDESALPAEEFQQELESMEDEKYKMVVSRQWDEQGEAQKEWYFRHDKIMDFFLVQNFLGKDEEVEKRLIDHIGDPRFRGVYFLLATLLPKDAAFKLREELIQYAADTKDHTVSDIFVQLLRTR